MVASEDDALRLWKMEHATSAKVPQLSAKAPLWLRLLPKRLRRRLKQALASHIENAVRLHLGRQLALGTPQLRQEDFAALYMRLRNADAKHIPIRPDRANYILPKASPSEAKWADGFEVPPKHLWHGYAPTIQQVMKIGEGNLTRMCEILKADGGQIGARDRLLDFGCAAGFMMRGLAPTTPQREVWGVDFSGPHIAWCMRHLSPPFHFVLTSSFPSLPFCEAYFDLVYCGSVFSHIGESADAWLLELARIIRPGGRLYLTLVTKDAMWEYFKRWPELGFSKSMQRAFTQKQLASDFATAVCGHGPGSHAVYDLDWFKAKCSPAFEVGAVVPNVYTYQAAMVLHRQAWERRI